jgi:hypothetical protein
MIEIDDIIELKTNLDTELLSFKTRYLVQINFTFDLRVISNGFQGTSHFCVRRHQIEKMCLELAKMKETLSGTTVLEDNDSDASVNFQIKSSGQIIVNGQVGGSHEENYLKFNFQTYQTYLDSFIEDFYKLLKYEDPKNLYENIDLVLWKDWDPIGINDFGPRDEYKGYTSTIFKIKTEGSDRETIAKTLYEIEVDTMGLVGNIDHCLYVAEKIVNLK